MRRLSFSNRPAFSLVEVVASLFLVGTLLVAILLAHRRAGAQLRLADKRLEAVAILDSLLEARERPDAGDLQLASGKAPGENPYFWRSTLRFEPGLEAFQGAVLRVELYEPDFEDGVALAFAELVAPSGAEAPAGGSP